MNVYTSTAICNIGLFALIGFAVYCTGSAWPLWALLCMMYTKQSKNDKKELDNEDK